MLVRLGTPSPSQTAIVKYLMFWLQMEKKLLLFFLSFLGLFLFLYFRYLYREQNERAWKRQKERERKRSRERERERAKQSFVPVWTKPNVCRIRGEPSIILSHFDSLPRLTMSLCCPTEIICFECLCWCGFGTHFAQHTLSATQTRTLEAWWLS